jgi:cold shock protein
MCERDQSPAIAGIVKWFLAAEGYGFILAQNGQSVFVHYTDIIGTGYRNLTEGETVEFEITETPKGPKAVNVRSLEPATNPEPTAQPEIQLAPLQPSLHSTVPPARPKKPVVFKRMPEPK